jgi:citrate lyase synthetase
MCCTVPNITLSLFYQSKTNQKTLKQTTMKKFLFSAQVIAIIAFVPAITFAYLRNDAPKTENTAKVENKNDMSGQHQTTGIIRLVKAL